MARLMPVAFSLKPTTPGRTKSYNAFQKNNKTYKPHQMHQFQLYLTILLNINGLLVGLRIQQPLKLRSIVDLDLRDPGITLRAVIDGLGLVIQEGVTLQHLSGHRGEDIGSGLDRFHSSDGLACADFQVRLGQLNEDDIAKGVGGVLGDSNLSCSIGIECQYGLLEAEVRGGRHDNAMGTNPSCRRRPIRSIRGIQRTSLPALKHKTR